MKDYGVEASDADLVALAREGDRPAFAELVRRHETDVFNLALRLGAGRDSASEIAQETWIRVWRGLAGFRGEATFSTWVYRITVNTASTYRHRRRREKVVDLSEYAEPEETRASALPEPMADNDDLRRRLMSALAELSPALRVVVVLKDIYCWTHPEIAQTLGISLTATKVRLHRGHQSLQRHLRGSGR